MVVRRTIEHMKTRPRDERIAFASTVAMSVMFILLIGGAFFSLASIRESGESAAAPSDTAISSLESF